MIIEAHVHTNANENTIISSHDNVYNIKIKAKAIDNKANIELIKFLSKKFNVDAKLIYIKSGKKSNIKLINIS